MNGVRFAVVGGGVSGLAAAWELSRSVPGSEIAVLEAGARLGGKLITEEREGFLLEASADSFLTRKTGVVDLLAELGALDLVTEPDPAQRGSWLWHQGRLHRLPAGLSGLVPSDPQALRQVEFLPPAVIERILAEADLPAAPPAHEETVRQFFSRRFGDQAFSQLFEPLLGGIFSGDSDQLSAAAAFPQLVAREQAGRSLSGTDLGAPSAEAQIVQPTQPGFPQAVGTDLRPPNAEAHSKQPTQPGFPQAAGTHLAPPITKAHPTQPDFPGSPRPEGTHLAPPNTKAHSAQPEHPPPPFLTLKPGLAALPALLADRLTARGVSRQPASQVRGLTPQTDGTWLLQTARGPLQADYVLLALPVHQTTPLLPPDLAAHTSAIPTVSVAVLHLALPADQLPRLPPGTGYVVHRDSGLPFTACTWISRKWPGRAPDGTLLLRFYFGSAHQPDAWQLPEPQMLEAVLDHLKTWTRGQTSPQQGQASPTPPLHPLFHKVYRWPNAMAQPTLGHHARLQALENALHNYPGLQLAGPWFDGVGLPDSITRARTAARRLLAQQRTKSHSKNHATPTQGAARV